MGTTKTQIHDQRQNELAGIFKVLGHPARIAILQYLARQQGCICNDIVEEIGLAQPTISQHLRELKGAGLIQGEVEGTRICYCINRKNWKILHKEISTFFDNTFTNCC